jgi:2-oxoglutarate ferredoxin oxidoreductase subunit delta
MTSRAPILPEPPPVQGAVHINTEWCKGCELCIDYCPTKVLLLSTGFNVKGYHYPEWIGENCINCRLCFTICPEFAIFATAVPTAV